jgi:uncharacterized repeat protein (TIGR01451 family)
MAVQSQASGSGSQAQIGAAAAIAERGSASAKTARGEARSGYVTGEVTGSRAIGEVRVTALRPELTIRKHVDRTRALPGDVITFSLTLRNDGPLPLRMTAIHDRLDDQLTLMRSEGATRYADQRDPHLLRFTLSDVLQPKAERIISITARVRGGG